MAWLTNRLTRMRIFLRIFCAFTLVAAFPIGIIILILNSSVQFLDTHGGGTVARTLQAETFLACCALLVFVLGVAFLINSTITRPLSHLAALARRIHQGETNARAIITGQDEIAIVGRLINSMLDSIVRHVQETKAQHDLLQSQVEKLVNEVSGVGEGDLRVQAEVSADTLGVLADAFNCMVEQLSSLIVRVKSVAFEVEAGTAIVTRQTNHLLTTATTQLGQIDTTSKTIETMKKASHQVAERTQILEETAHKTNVAVQSGRGSVEEMLAGIEQIQANVHESATSALGLNKHSHQIDGIIEVIAGFAQQTNRLALDASIQAAMAGDQGKGFQAIAGDIRRLAEKTKEQVQIITNIGRSVRNEIAAVSESVKTIEQETAHGVSSIQDMRRTLSTIFGVVEQQSYEIGQINQMINRQSSSLREITRVMQIASETTQEGSKSTHIITQKMQYMTRIAEQLLISVEAFHLSDHQKQGVTSGNERPRMQ